MTNKNFLNFQIPHSIAFGGGAISGEGAGYGFGAISEEESIDLLHYAFDKGFRIFDTAPIYGFGTSETRMGKAFQKMREKVLLVSKSGVDWHENNRVNMSNDPVVTQKMLEASLKRLQTDYIDLYMIHWPDEKVDIRKPLEVLVKAQQEGKIKHIGLSNTTIEDLEKAKEVAKIEVVQSEFNLFNNTLSESLFPYLKKNSIQFMSWGSLDKGVISGTVNEKRSFDSSDARNKAPWWKSRNNQERFDFMKLLSIKLQAENISGVQLALSYNLSFPELTVALCGPKNKSQVDSLVEAEKNLLSQKSLNLLLE